MCGPMCLRLSGSTSSFVRSFVCLRFSGSTSSFSGSTSSFTAYLWGYTSPPRPKLSLFSLFVAGKMEPSSPSL